MSSIDDRVVNMQFNNAQFQQGVAQTQKSLDGLKQSLKLDNATSGIDDVQAAADHFSLQGMEDALSSISSHFSVFGAVGFTIIQDLTNGVLNAGRKMAGALIDPIVQGGANRALALQQAKFQFQGLGLDIQSTMDAALAAVKGTAFGLDDAATAAAQFGASGITAASGLSNDLRAVAGVAAQTGSSYSSVAQIFESVAGNGRLMGQDLLQLSSRGVNAAAVLAKSMGTTEAKVREMVTNGKISFQEFSDAMYKSFGANAANANQTYSGALDNMHAALARIGADVASPHFLGMRDIFNALGPLFDTIHTAIQPVLNEFGLFQNLSAKTLVDGINQVNDGIAKFLGSGFGQGLKNILLAAETLAEILSKAFAQIFPPETGAQLKSVADGFQKFTAMLIPGQHAVDDILRAFKGFFAIIDIGIQLLSAIGEVIAKIFGFSIKSSGGILDFAAKIGDFLVKVDQAIKKGNDFNKFFMVLGGIIAAPIALLKAFFGVVADGVKDVLHLNGSTLDNFGSDVENRFKGLVQLGQFFKEFWDKAYAVAKAVWDWVKPIFETIGDAIHTAAVKVKDSLKGLKFDDALQAINTGLFAGFLLLLRGFFGNIGGVLQGNGLAFVSSFKKVFGALQLNLKALEQNTNSKTLENIAISIALLAASAVALSLVDSTKMALALGAIGTMVAGLLAAFSAFGKMGGTKGILESIALAAALDGIATAILILTGAIAILGALPMDNLIQGVIALVVILAALAGTLKLLGDTGPKVLFGAAAIAILAPAMAAMAGAVAILASLPFTNLVQGMGAFTLILGEMVGAITLLKSGGPGLLFAAVALTAMGGAMATIVGVIALLGALKMGDLIQGLVAMALALGILAGAMAIMQSDIGGAVSMVIAAAAITILAGALKIVATMSWDDIGRTMVVLAGSLLILAGAMAIMGIPEVLLGAVGITAAALALALIAPALVLLGTMSWDAIGRGLTVLGAGILIAAVGGLLLIPASVGFLLFGAAILLIGTGILEAATGVALFAVAIGMLAAVGTVGIKLIEDSIQAVIDKLPALGTGIGKAIIAMAQVIGDDAPQLVVAFAKIFNALLDAAQSVIPHIVTVGTKIILAFLDAMTVLLPAISNAGLTILQKVLEGIASHMSGIVKAGSDVIINFINGISANLPRILQAAANLAINFINGLANTLRSNQARMNDAGANLAWAIADGLTGGMASKVRNVANAAIKMVEGIPSAIKKFLGINSPSKVTTELGEWTGEGFAVGFENKSGRINSAADAMAAGAVTKIKDAFSGISDAMSEHFDTTPTIRPVVDTSGIKAGAAQINGLLNGAPSLSLNTSTDVATSVALQEQANNARLVLNAQNVDPNTGKQLVFNQYNNSPAALSTEEIYRQTSNQLSTLRGELGVVNQSPTNQ